MNLPTPIGNFRGFISRIVDILSPPTALGIHDFFGSTDSYEESYCFESSNYGNFSSFDIFHPNFSSDFCLLATTTEFFTPIFPVIFAYLQPRQNFSLLFSCDILFHRRPFHSFLQVARQNFPHQFSSYSTFLRR